MTGPLSQRNAAGLLALAVTVALLLSTWLTKVAYVTYTPGDTFNVLGDFNKSPIIEVTGHPVYRDAGQLRMVTVFVTRPDYDLSLLEAMSSWVRPSVALYPRSAIYPKNQSVQQSEQESQVEMASSQDAAVAAALTDLGYKLTPHLSVISVNPNTPAAGKLEVHDLILTANGANVTSDKVLVGAITQGGPVRLGLLRAGKPVDVTVTPTMIDGKRRVGVLLGTGFQFPFQVHLNLASNIGGPSAGLMFSLGIYDTLTPGSLTDGHVIAGTGTIDVDGKVGPIGGIQQKIVAARESGAKLFFVPADNCTEAVDSDPGSMRLVRVSTMHEATSALTVWDANPNATLPTCEVHP